MSRNTWLLLGGAAVVYFVIKQQQQQQLTPAQLVAQAKRDLEPLTKPIVS